eukprot:Em0203g4a
MYEGNKYAYTADLLALDCCRPQTPSLIPEVLGGVTPLHYSVWELALRGHPDAEFVHYFCAGLRFGFRIGFDHRRTLRSANSNMMSAFQHPEPIAEYIEKELKRFGVIPKGHNEGKWRLITDLSYPTGHSVNDGINPALCSLRYTTVEIVASEAAALGPGALIAKRTRILDDFVVLGAPGTDECEKALSTLVGKCTELGIPLATHKTEGPATSIKFLGASGQQGACSCATGGCRPFAGPGGGLDLALQSGCGSSALFSPRLSLINAQVIRLGLRRFYSFCTKYDVFTPFPVTEKLLCYFAAALANEGLAPQTIKCYLSGVRSMQISLGLPPPRDQSSLPILKRVLDGIRRSTAAQAGGRPRKIRLPITAAVLRGIQGPLSLRMGQDSTAFWAIAVVAFFGFFRLGELLLESRTTYNSVLHLSWGDISIDSLTNPSMVEVYLKKSKCDQFGAGADVLLGRSGGQLCPVTAILDYINVRRDTPGYFFVESQEKPISKARFIAGLREALKESGYPDDQYAGHSFCIGAATAAAIAGVEDSLIQTLGRWHSAAFLRYFRTPHDQLAPN